LVDSNCKKYTVQIDNLTGALASLDYYSIKAYFSQYYALDSALHSSARLLNIPRLILINYEQQAQ